MEHRNKEYNRTINVDKTDVMASGGDMQVINTTLYITTFKKPIILSFLA